MAKSQEFYNDKIIEYKDSPTGKAYIGFAKTPLMKNKDGYGFKGVLLQDDKKELVQCASCGKFMKRIVSKHLIKCSKGKIKNTEEYRIKYGLGLSTGLVSDAQSLRLTEFALKNKKMVELFKKGAMHSWKKGLEKQQELAKTGRYKQTVQKSNLFGTCPLQLLTQLVVFVNNNKELPGRRNKGVLIYKRIYRKYGSFPLQIAKWGFPLFQRTGTNYKYTFSDGEVYKYNINRSVDRDKLYNKMVEKCPVLSAKNLEKFID